MADASLNEEYGNEEYSTKSLTKASPSMLLASPLSGKDMVLLVTYVDDIIKMSPR